MMPLQYSILVDRREFKVKSTDLRFAKTSSINPFLDIEEEEDRRRICCLSLKGKNEDDEATPFHLMTPTEKRERLAYLRYRMKIVAEAALFIYTLRKI